MRSDESDQSSPIMRLLDVVVLYSGVYVVYVSGTAQYYGGLDNVYRMAYFFGPIVFLACALRGGLRNATLTWPIGSLLLWFLWLNFSSVANEISIELFVLGLKIYTPAVLCAIGLAFWPRPKELIERMERCAVWVPIFQLPFVIHQAFWVQARRSGTSWDSIVGTFGGDPSGGGNNSGLALSTTIAVMISLYLRRHRKISRWFFLSVLMSASIILVLSEVKLYLLLAPALIVISTLHNMSRRPGAILLTAILVPVFVVSMLNAYQFLYWGKQGPTSIGESLIASADYFFDPNGVSFETGEVSRAASFSLWYQDTVACYERCFLGYGMASTRSNSAVSVGDIGRRFYPLDVGSTAVAQLLWDGGGVAATLFFVALLSGLFRSRQLIASLTVPLNRDRLGSLKALLVGIIVLQFYNRSFVDLPFEQFLLAFVLGIVANRSAWCYTSRC